MPEPIPVRVGTYNVLDPGLATLAPWDLRRENVAQTIVGSACGILCVQEIGLTALARELDVAGDLAKLTGMTLAPVSKDGVGFLYDSGSWSVARGGWFRLPRPRGDHHRSAVWQPFTHRASGRRLLAVGTHLSPQPAFHVARARQAAVLARRIERRGRVMPTMILGDFNSWAGRVPITPMDELTRGGFRDAHLVAPDIGSAHLGSMLGRSNNRRLDHIAVSTGIAVMRTGIDSPDFAAPASDHRLLWADLEVAG